MSQATTLTRGDAEVTQLSNQVLPPMTIAREFRRSLPVTITAETYTSLKMKNGDDFTRDTEFLAVRASDWDARGHTSYLTGSMWFKPLPEEHAMSETHFMTKDSRGDWSELLATRVVFAYPKLELGKTYQVLWSTDVELMHGATVQCMGESTEDHRPLMRILSYSGESLSSPTTVPEDAVMVEIEIPSGRPVFPTSVDRLWDAEAYAEAFPPVADGDPAVGVSHEEYRKTRIIDALAGAIVGLEDITCNTSYLMTGIDHRDNINTHLTPITPADWVIGQVDTDGDIREMKVINRVDFDIVTATRRRGTAVIHRNVRDIGAEIPFKAYSLRQGWLKHISGSRGDGDPVKEMRLTEATRTITELTDKREKMNEALNELASEQDWCSEFEDSVIPLGFDGREGRSDVEYSVEIDVDFTYSEEDLGHGDRSSMESIAGLNDISSINVEATGTARVTVSVTAPRNAGDDGDLSEYVSTDDVINEIGNSYVTVDDWTITGYEYSE